MLSLTKRRRKRQSVKLQERKHKLNFSSSIFWTRTYLLCVSSREPPCTPARALQLSWQQPAHWSSPPACFGGLQHRIKHKKNNPTIYSCLTQPQKHMHEICNTCVVPISSHVAGDNISSPETFLRLVCSVCAKSQTIHKHQGFVAMHNISFCYRKQHWLEGAPQCITNSKV